jgi:transcription initiation factor TFIID subunit 6
MVHSKRDKLTTEDINSALKLRNMEVLLGYVRSDDRAMFKRAAGSMDLFFLSEVELDFDEILSAELPSLPRMPSLSSHWLAVEGVQPAIPENPKGARAHAHTRARMRVTLSDRAVQFLQNGKIRIVLCK